MQIWFYLCASTSIFFRNGKGDISSIVLAVPVWKKTTHSCVGQPWMLFVHTDSNMFTLWGETRQPAHSQKWQEPFSECYPSVRTTGAVKWPLTDGDSDDKPWVCLWLWWIQINIHSFSITGCRALTRSGGGGNTGSQSWLLSGVGWGYTLDKTPVYHMATQTTLTPRKIIQGSCSA